MVRILDGAQGEFPEVAVLLRWRCSLLLRLSRTRIESLCPGTRSDDEAVIRQLPSPVQAHNPGLDVQARGADSEQLRRFVGRLG